MTALNQARPNREDMTWGAEGDLGGYMLTQQELEAATAKRPHFGYSKYGWPDQLSQQEIEQTTAKSDQSGYDLYTADQLSAQEIESATAEYHMYKDMSAMAARIDQLEAENDRLQRALLNRMLIP